MEESERPVRAEQPEDYSLLDAGSVHDLLTALYVDADEFVVELPGGREVVVMRDADESSELVVTHIADDEGHRYEVDLYTHYEMDGLIYLEFHWRLEQDDFLNWGINQSEKVRVSDDMLRVMESYGYAVLFSDETKTSEPWTPSGHQLTYPYEALRLYELVEPGPDHRIYEEDESA